MHEADLGSEMLARLRELMGVEAGWAEQDTRFHWSLWGALQRGWSESATGADGWPNWRLQLRTTALEGFSGSNAQLDALSAEPAVPTLASVIRTSAESTRLELASSLEVRGSEIGWVLWLLAVAARLQALEARRLSASMRLAEVGLTPGADLAMTTPADLEQRPEAVVLGAQPSPGRGPGWAAAEIAACVEALNARPSVRAAATARGVAATLPFGAGAVRSSLELHADARHSLLGRGLSAVLQTPSRRGMAHALALNEREVGPRGRGDALGGWWPAARGLAYSSFHPGAFRPPGFGAEVALAYARRAVAVAAGEPTPATGPAVD